MKLITIVIILFSSLAVQSQDVDRPDTSLRVKEFVANLLPASGEVDVLLRDLTSRRGKLISTGADSFVVNQRMREGGHRGATILYRHALEIKSGEKILSFVPDPSFRPYGEWDDVKGIAAGHPIAVLLPNGKEMTGRFGGATDATLVLLGDTDAAKLEIKRIMITHVLGWQNDLLTNKRTRKGSSEGPTPSGRPVEDALIWGAVLGVKGLGAVGKSTDSRLILVYSR